jgi:hypothetical protein
MHFVASGNTEKTYHHLDTPEDAALLFVEIETGPFGEVVVVDEEGQESKFFHTKTLLQEVEENNQRVLTLLDEETT